jgi:glycosyltransferase involved in cell wall biosynthesis
MIITVSNETKKNIMLYFGQDKKIEVIYNSVDKVEINKDFKNSFHYFLIIGGVNKDKNIDKILIGFKLFLDNNKKLNDLPIKLFIAGSDQGYLKEILSLIDILGLTESVKYLGYISNSDKIQRRIKGKIGNFKNPRIFDERLIFFSHFARRFG